MITASVIKGLNKLVTYLARTMPDIALSEKLVDGNHQLIFVKRRIIDHYRVLNRPLFTSKYHPPPPISHSFTHFKQNPPRTLLFQHLFTIWRCINPKLLQYTRWNRNRTVKAWNRIKCHTKFVHIVLLFHHPIQKLHICTYNLYILYIRVI